MACRREMSPSRKMRRIALVICEGETEVCYINLLKKWYKSPVKIVPHIEGTKITQSLIDARTRELKISAWDKVNTFIMYDMDVKEVVDKLLSCKAEMLLSNPCFEIWLLLHAKAQKTSLDTVSVLKELKKSNPVWRHYNKSCFTQTQKAFLKDNKDAAVKRAKTLEEFQNPWSGVYKLIDLLSE